MAHMNLMTLLLTQQGATKLNVFVLIWEAGLVVKLVILSLLLLSGFSLAIIIERYKLFKTAKHENGRFAQVFVKSNSLDEIAGVAKKYTKAPFAALYTGGYEELNQLNGGSKSKKSKTLSIKEEDMTNINRALYGAASQERLNLEYRLPFLATTGSAAPFIGLFGTVWGIMNSFRNIGALGSANLAVVAPGIAEALIATAFGLVAAIPAVMAYNYFTNQVRIFDTQMDFFIAEYLNRLRRS